MGLLRLTPINLNPKRAKKTLLKSDVQNRMINCRTFCVNIQIRLESLIIRYFCSLIELKSTYAMVKIWRLV